MDRTNYKLIISDFDGTLVRADGTVSEENKSAITDYINAGGIFAISTGRLPSSILPRAKALGLKGLLCCCQGTIILDIESGEVVFDERLSMEATLAACRKMEEMGLHIHAFDMWDFYSNMDDDLLKHYEKAAGTRAKLVIDRKLSDLLEEKQMRVYKLLAVVYREDNARILAELNAAGLEGCAITKSADFLVEVVNPKYSKSSALLFLAERYGISLEKTIAIGDNYNDISMIERAGLGIAVKNAENALKERAGYVSAYTNEESAVADIIKKFGFCK